MADTGWVLVGTGTNSTGAFSDPWNNPGNITADDGTNARSGALKENQETDFLHGTNCGFSIAAGNQIDGIEVRIQRRDVDGDNNITDHTVQLVVGGSRTGDNNADLVTTYPASPGNADYGGPTDLWGLTPTLAQVNASDFGVAFAAVRIGSSLNICDIDVMWIKVHYSTAPAASGTDRFFLMF